MLSGSGVLYTWQVNLLAADTIVQNQSAQIAQLEIENTSLKVQAKKNEQTITEQQTTLASIESQLQSAKASLETTERELNKATSQLNSQQSQLASNATELEALRNRPPLFSFRNQSSEISRADEELAVKTLVTTAYQYLQTLYGRPYLLNQVTISFVDSFSIAAATGETVISNGPSGLSVDIRMKDFSLDSQDDVTTLIHELIHTFHGVAVFDDAALEEGITVSATDAVLEQLIRDGHIPRYPYLYLRSSEAQLTRWNTTLSIPAGSTAFYSGDEVSLRYQLVGSAWMRLYRADSAFFSKFNAAYYSHIQRGEKATAELVRQIIKEVMPLYNNQPIQDYLNSQSAFNPQ
jgi:archaellum component FlaC